MSYSHKDDGFYERLQEETQITETNSEDWQSLLTPPEGISKNVHVLKILPGLLGKYTGGNQLDALAESFDASAPELKADLESRLARRNHTTSQAYIFTGDKVPVSATDENRKALTKALLSLDNVTVLSTNIDDLIIYSVDLVQSSEIKTNYSIKMHFDRKGLIDILLIDEDNITHVKRK